MKKPASLLAFGLILAIVALAAAAPEKRERRRRGRRVDNSPKVGAMAPDFELIRLAAVDVQNQKPAEEKAVADKAKEKKPKTVRLSSFRTQKPVVFVLCSYT